MLIRVRYAAGTYDYVSPACLDDLIESDAITQFFRSGSWATLGIDPVRTRHSPLAYIGLERRQKQKALSLAVVLARPLLKKIVYAVLICLTFIISTLLGTSISAMLCPSVELEDPYSQIEIDKAAHYYSR